LALLRAGMRTDRRSAMMAITTNNSINVKPLLFFMRNSVFSPVLPGGRSQKPKNPNTITAIISKMSAFVKVKQRIHPLRQGLLLIGFFQT
jgi:hypothetical protein